MVLWTAPFVPLDGVNDAGVSCGIYMSYQGSETVAGRQMGGYGHPQAGGKKNLE